MNARIGWALALAAVVLASIAYGWQGLLVAFSVIVFWLLLQFNRAVRVMKNAAGRPVGHVPSAVMLNAKLAPRMTMMQVVSFTRSLGTRRSESPEVWVWTDPGGASVAVTFEAGTVSAWSLERGA